MNGKTDTLISGLVDQLEPVRPFRFSHGMTLALTGIGLAALLVMLLFAVRPDVVSGQPQGIFLLASGLFLLLGIACAASVVMMASPRIGSGRNGWGWALAMAGVLPISALILALIRGSAAWQESEPSHGVYCLGYAILFGLITGAALVLWLRRGAPTSPERAGLLTGIAAGSAGIFAFSFACPIDSVMHIGLWHGLPVTLSAIIGRFAVPPLIRW
ncbi:MAG: DUF1109 domain-containing protein [Sphingomonadaceae bacterium]|nr:DUF1109 domain-containing protein [Sphingomonadaceae bacterium]